MIAILFMYIFSFPLFKNIMPVGSNFVIGFFLFLNYLFSNNYREIVNSLFNKKYIIRVFLILIFVNIYSFLIPSILNTYDYSIIYSFFSQFVTLSIGIFVFGLYKKNNIIDKLPQHLIYIFFIQSCIQIISFLSPSINEFLNIFRIDGAISIGQNDYYGGARGLAVAGQSFFGLGIGYALIYLFIFKYWKNITPNFPPLRFLILLTIVFGGLSAARISLVGVIMGLIYLVLQFNYLNNIKSINIGKKIKISTFLILCFMIIFILNVILINEYYPINAIFGESWKNFVNYAFEFIAEFNNSGNFGTKSTDVLFNKMYFSIDNWQTLIIGDGRYLNIDGSYYMSTDAGYMRNILFFGIIGLLLLFLYQICFFFWENKKYRVFNFTIIICILILHIKGEILGFSTMILCILILFLQYQAEESLKS